MNNEVILKSIGKGQITIPQAWRIYLGIDQKYVRAKLEDNRIIIEPFEKESIDWDVKKIRLNVLNKETIDEIKKSEKEYKVGNKDFFLSHDEFWSDV